MSATPRVLTRALTRAATLALAGVAGTACVATRQDVQILRNDLAAMQAASARADSLRARETARLLEALGVVRDSVRALAARDARFAGDTREALRTINEQLLQVQELTGQSQRRLQELRATLEPRTATVEPPATPTPPSGGAGEGGARTTGAGSAGAGGAAGGAAAGAAGAETGGTAGARRTSPRAGATGAAPGTSPGGASPAGAPRTAPADTAVEIEAGPGPNELHKLALDQYRRGAWGAARTGFLDLLRRYPTADVAPEAQFYVAETWASERNTVRADDAYAAVVTRYPQSSRAPTALYKRARLKVAAGRRDEARALFEDVVRRYPRSDEAVLSREALRTLDR